MNRVPVIERNPAYVADVELDEDEVDPADITPLISGNTPIVTVPASEDEDKDEEMEDVCNFESHWEHKSIPNTRSIKTTTLNIIEFQNNIRAVKIKFLVKGMNF